MSLIGGRCFNSPEKLYDEIEREFQHVGIMILSKIDHDYHFIIEISHSGAKIGRLKVNYNKDNQCKKVQVLDPLNSTYYKMISEILPISKGTVLASDFLSDFFQSNYRYAVEIIHSSELFTCYEIKPPSKQIFVWIKVFKSGDKSCYYVNGNSDLFDEIQYIYEEEVKGSF